MKIARTLVTLILSAAMVTGSILPAFAADGNGQEPINLVAIGASETNGWGFDNYLNDTHDNYVGWKVAPEGVYPKLMKNYLEDRTGRSVNLDQFTVVGARAEEFRVLLDDYFGGDTYTKWKYYDPNNKNADNWLINMEGSIEKSREVFQDGIKNADVITLSLGGNSFGTYLVTRLTTNKLDDDTTSTISDGEAVIAAGALRAILNGMARTTIESSLQPLVAVDLIDTKTIKLISNELQRLNEALLYSYAEYCSNMKVILSKIKEVNPDAQVVVMSVPDMAGDLSLYYGDVKLPVNDMWSKVTSLANTYVKGKAKDFGCQYVDTTETKVTKLGADLEKYNGDPKTITSGMKDIIRYYDWYFDFNDIIGTSTDEFSVMVEKAIEDASKKDVDKDAVYDAAYDAVVKYFKQAYLVGGLQIKDFLADGFKYNATVKKVRAEIYELADKAARKELGEEGYKDFDLDAEIASFLGDGANATMAYLFVDILYGSAVFSHPNLDAHANIYNEIKGFIEKPKNCSHKWTKTEDAKKATYFEKGYTGDKVCSICGNVEAGKELPCLKYSVKYKSVPCKVKQSFKAASNMNLVKGDAIASVKSSNSKIAKVSGTTVKGVKKGTATITVKMKKNSNTYSFKVNVQKGAVKCSKLTTKVGSNIKLKKGQKVSIGASKAPFTCKYGITYKSSKKKIATVSKKGVITAKKKGTAKITVKCKGKSKTIKVTVK